MRFETSRWQRWLNRPLSNWQCALGWLFATVLFVGIIALLGGPSIIDLKESIYSTWAIAHGRLTCAYPAASLPKLAPAPPLYPLLSGAIVAIAHLGTSPAFPSATALGPHCDRPFTHMDAWAARSGATDLTTWVSVIGWLVLLAGVVALLRASGRGRSEWERVTVIGIALFPPVWMCIQSDFHPQDLLALGLVFSAMACAIRQRWIASGFLIALAVLSHQYALLAAAPLFIVAPAHLRMRFIITALATYLLVTFPFLVTAAGHAVRGIALGTGDSPSIGGTVMWELHLHGLSLILLSRVLPIALSVGFTLWVKSRLGPFTLEPPMLLSVVAVSLALRLVFEQNLFPYYFMALGVSLIVLDVVLGHLRRTVLAWLVTLIIPYCLLGSGTVLGFRTWGRYVTIPFTSGVILGTLAFILFRTFRHGDRWHPVAWLVICCAVVGGWPTPSEAPVNWLPTWFWQMTLVPTGLLLALQPILSRARFPNLAPIEVS